MTYRGRILGSTALISFISLASYPAMAALDELIVTAEKREASVQDVPIAITAVSGDYLDDFAIDDIMDIYVQTPGMSFSRAGGEAQIYIRGIGTDAFGVTVDPSVALHMDGVYLGRPQMGLQQFLDIERVEILKGPQGTLYGRNATGGAVNIISRMPTDEFSGYVSAGYGNFDRREVKGAISGPIGGNFKGRLAARYLKDDGFTYDIEPGGSEEIDDQDMFAVRGILQYDNDSNFDITVIGDYTDFKSGNRTSIPLDDLSMAVVLGAALDTDFDETRNDLNTFFDWDTGGINVTMNYDFGGVTLTSVTGYREYESDFFFNTDGTEIEVTRSYFQYKSEQVSEELRLQSNGDGPFQWLIGGYYLHEDKEGVLGLGRQTHPDGPRSFIIPNDDTTDAWAVFGQASYDFTEQLTATLGLRYSDEEKEDFTSVGAIFGDITGLASTMPVTVFFTRSEEASWDDLSPRFALEYRPNDDTMIYGSVTKGFKSGGWNAFDGSPSFDQEEVWSYEVGFKSDLTDRLRLNGTGFYYDYSDLQVSAFKDGLTVTTNAAEATVWGVEFDLTATPIDELTLTANVGYLNAEYDEFISTFGDITGVDLSGNTLVNAPEWKASFAANYAIPLNNSGRIDLTTQISYQSRVYHTQHNENLISQGAFALLNARAAYVSPDERWEISLWGKNLGDEQYFQNTVRFTSLSQGNPADVNNIGAGLGYPASGRSFGVEATFNF